MEIEKCHCAFGLPKLAQSTRQWAAHSDRTLQRTTVHTLGTRSPCCGKVSVCGALRSPMAQWWTNGNKIDGTSIYEVQATRRYTHSSTATTGKGSSPEQRAVWRWRSASRALDSTKWKKSSSAQFLCCTMPAQVWYRWQRGTLAAGDEEGVSHWWWRSTDATCVGESRYSADGSETWGKRCSSTRQSAGWKELRIGCWTWMLAGSGWSAADYTSLEGKWWKEGSFSRLVAFIARGERQASGSMLAHWRRSANGLPDRRHHRHASTCVSPLFLGH
jgi:hypothetical protein